MDFNAVAELMNRVPEVKWDRCVVGEVRGCAYGWIDRDDGKKDFFLLMWDSGKWGFTTSSAKYSREFSERLFGTSQGHRDCQRIEDVFGDLVEHKITLRSGAA